MRTICWFSCGAASAVATKLVLSSQPEALAVYTHVTEEHEDNARFLRDCERWFARPIQILVNAKYQGSIYEVFRRERYLVGPGGAPCTKHLKRKMRDQFAQPGDVHVLGFTVEEQERAEEFAERNPELTVTFPLIEQHLTKGDCLGLLDSVGISLPVMYRLGYDHNNCIGCVKGGKGYWNKIRRDFPAVFTRMATMEREIGASLIRENGISVYLDELDPSAGLAVKEPSIECSIFCEMAKTHLV